MKIYSDSAVTKSDLSSIDAKQDRQIRQVKFLAIGMCLVNLAITLGLKFL